MNINKEKHKKMSYTEPEPSTRREGAQSWVNRMADLYEEQQRRDRIIAEGREAALNVRRSVLAGCLTNELKIK